jgi:hypothetical protein
VETGYSPRRCDAPDDGEYALLLWHNSDGSFYCLPTLLTLQVTTSARSMMETRYSPRRCDAPDDGWRFLPPPHLAPSSASRH